MPNFIVGVKFILKFLCITLFFISFNVLCVATACCEGTLLVFAALMKMKTMLRLDYIYIPSFVMLMPSIRPMFIIFKAAA